MAKKLKFLKEDLKVWNREVFGQIDLRLKKILEEIQVLDEIEGLGGLSSDDISRWIELRTVEERLLICEEVCWRQKFGVQWLKEGNKNTKFFHRVANANKVANQIRIIFIDSVLIEDKGAIKDGIVGFYHNLYSDPQDQRPQLDGLAFKSLEVEDKLSL